MRMAFRRLRLDTSSWRASGGLCARGPGVPSEQARDGWEPDAALTRMRAVWKAEPWGGRGSLAGRPSFQVSLGPEAGSGAGAAGVRFRPARLGRGK